jgi:thiamine pyrophosphokinase
MRYIIVTGGPLPDEASELIRSLSDLKEEKVIIACDSGCDHLARLNIVPDILIGDMDSISAKGLKFAQKNTVFTEHYPVEKDWTDTEIALNKTEKGDKVTLVCPISARIDHVIANLGIALKLKSEGRDIVVTDGVTYCYPLTGEDKVQIDVTSYEGNAAVSLIPWNFGKKVKGVTTKGLYYPLTEADLTAGSSFSFSNHPKKSAKKISISIKSGMLLIAITKSV